MSKNKFIFVFLFIFVSWNSFTASIEDFKVGTESVVGIQEKYDSLSEVVPGFIMLPIEGTSAIPTFVKEEFKNILNREMVLTDVMKPVSLEKWLIGKFGLEKAKNSKDFVTAIFDERYPCTISGLCQPYIFQLSDKFVILLSFYRLADKGFPITVLRHVSSLDQMAKAIAAMLKEYNLIIESKNFENGNKIKVIVKPFTLESRTYIGHSKGEFDYISASFIEQDGIIIKGEDDFFSRLFSYSLYTTEMVKSVSCLDLNQYVNSKYNSYGYADFVIEGRIQLTDQINIYHISLKEASSNKIIKEVKYFSSDFSLSGVWEAYNNVIYSLADYLFGKEGYGVVPDIYTPGQGLFINNIFLGWDKLQKCVLPKGKHFIYTGDYLQPDAFVEIKAKDKAVDINGDLYRSFFLYLDERNWIFRGKDGERVWKLLEK